jgi:hypothetical protein
MVLPDPMIDFADLTHATAQDRCARLQRVFGCEF